MPSFLAPLLALFRAQHAQRDGASFVEVEGTDDTEDLDVAVGDPRLPSSIAGKGIFVQSVKKATLAGTPEALAARAVALGLDWVALLVIWQHPDRDRVYEQVATATAACKARGVEVWLWGWPERGEVRNRTFIDVMLERYHETDARGLVVNAEKPFYGKPKEAELFCSLLGQLPIEIPVGLSSYGLPDYHGAFPWGPFASVCVFGMPQIYDSNHNQGPTYPRRCMAAWTKRGFPQLAPTWGASNAHTAEQMSAIIELTPRAPACCWWDLAWLRHSVKRAAVVRDMSWWPKATLEVVT